jgi:hypothetical protein
MSKTKIVEIIESAKARKLSDCFFDEYCKIEQAEGVITCMKAAAINQPNDFNRLEVCRLESFEMQLSMLRKILHNLMEKNEPFKYEEVQEALTGLNIVDKGVVTVLDEFGKTEPNLPPLVRAVRNSYFCISALIFDARKGLHDFLEIQIEDAA